MYTIKKTFTENWYYSYYSISKKIIEALQTNNMPWLQENFKNGEIDAKSKYAPDSETSPKSILELALGFKNSGALILAIDNKAEIDRNSLLEAARRFDLVTVAYFLEKLGYDQDLLEQVYNVANKKLKFEMIENQLVEINSFEQIRKIAAIKQDREYLENLITSSNIEIDSKEKLNKILDNLTPDELDLAIIAINLYEQHLEKENKTLFQDAPELIYKFTKFQNRGADFLKFLCEEKNYNLNIFTVINDQIKTPLIEAIDKKLHNSVNYILQNGANKYLNQLQNKGVYPLHLAVERGDFTTIALLIENGMDSNIVNNEFKIAQEYTKNDDLKNFLSVSKQLEWAFKTNEVVFEQPKSLKELCLSKFVNSEGLYEASKDFWVKKIGQKEEIFSEITSDLDIVKAKLISEKEERKTKVYGNPNLAKSAIRELLSKDVCRELNRIAPISKTESYQR
ncbi:MAG: hypothetical protein ACK4OM_03095 [Alphaproteobacteria bacterium]